MAVVKYAIYQLPVDHPNCFRPWPPVAPVVRKDYDKVFEEVRDFRVDNPVAICENIWARHNGDDRPAADRIRSLSVSDVVAFLDDSGAITEAYYVNTFGIVGVPGF